MADPTQTVTPVKAPIAGSTLARAGVVAGGIVGGPQLLVPLIHQWDLVHYTAINLPMPSADYEWSLASIIVAVASLLPSIFIRGQAFIAQDLGRK